MKSVIIVAGGKGLRMGTDIPKQFLPVKGLPVLMRTINAFRQYDSNITVVLVLPREQQEFWKELCIRHGFAHPHIIADGGETRYHSVKNGLSKLSGEGLIAVHDGVRPFVSQKVIARCFEAAALHRAVIPVLPAIETVRHIEEDGSSVTVNRDEYCMVQTPQVFDAQLLFKAYGTDYSPHFTDDASVVEALGEKIFLVEGNRENIKITTPFDLRIGEVLV